MKDKAKEKVTVAKPPKKNKFWTLVFVAFNLIALGAVVLMEQNQGTNVDVSQAIYYVGRNIGWFILALGMYVLALQAEAAGYTDLVYSTTGKYRHSLGARLSIIGKYYDNITPLATGGQPFQVHTLTKRGLHAGTATSVVLIKYFVRQFVFILSTLSFLVFSPHRPEPLLIVLAILGLLLMVAIPVGLVFVGFNKRHGERVLAAIVKLAHKIRLVKDYDKTYSSFMTQVSEFRTSLIFLFKRKISLFLQLIVAAIEVFAQLSVPYLVYRAFGMYALDYYQITTLYVYCLLAVSFVPTPGTAGAAEASFYTVFGALITNGTTFWALLVWRFATYYVYLAVGLLLQAKDVLVKVFYPRARYDDLLEVVHEAEEISEAGGESAE